jgi:F420H(2)-dependent quinone reductase
MPPKIIWSLFVGLYTFLYRITGGMIGGRMAKLPVLLLTTTGRKSGKRRVRPLGYLEHDGGYVIIGSNGGTDSHPAWYYNLKANPSATIQIKDRKFPVVAEVIEGEERNRLWDQLVRVSAQYGGYQKNTARIIPLVLLRPAA